MRKRLMALSLAIVMLGAQLVACSAPAPATKAPPPTAAASAAATAPTAAPAAAAPTAAPVAPAPTQPRKPSGTVTVGILSLEAQAGTAAGGSAYAMTVLSNVQELLIYNSREGKLIPGLAESWEMSKDGSKITFHLRKGIQFHEGWGEFTSQDVKFTAELLMDPKVVNSMRPYFQQYVQSIDTPDSYTVVFNMKRPTFDFFSRISNQIPYFPIASKKYVESVGIDGANKRFIGTGSWQFVEYMTGTHAKFKAVENHWRRTPDFANLIMREVPDSATTVMMLKTGELDAAAIPMLAIKELEQSGLEIQTSPGPPFWLQFGGMYLPTKPTFKKTDPWVADPADTAAWERAKKVRLAMAMAIDKKVILDTIFAGKGSLTAVPVMAPFMPGYDPNWKQYPYDPEGAKKLLAEAGYPNGFSTTMTVFSAPAREELVDVGIAAAAMLEKMGIQIKSERVEQASVMLPRISARTAYGLFPYATALPEALSMWDNLGRSDTSRMWLGEHTELDKLLKEAMGELDFDKRAKLQTGIGNWFIDNVWSVPIATKDQLWALNPKKVRDWATVPLANYPIQSEYLYSAQ